MTLLTGAEGLLGQHLIHYPEIIPTTRATMDITDPLAVADVIARTKPSAIIHAAAMTQVDPCELDPASCRRVNIEATERLAQHAARIGARFIFLSTDFIFDGLAGPYREDDTPNPLSVYGRSKWEAEECVRAVPNLDWTIVRTVLVYGPVFRGTRSNIISWVRSSLEAGKPIQVVSDQWRTPTYVGDLARGIHAIITRGATGIYHISGRDFLTPYDMAIRTARLLSLDESLISKVDASTFTQPGRRPARTGFVIDKAIRDLDYNPISFEEGILLTLGK
jgi:dTDP-4-dehydrorhamnose reductase